MNANYKLELFILTYSLKCANINGMEYTNKELLKQIENGSSDTLDCTTTKKPTVKKKNNKANVEFKKKYFEYYDDVKTNIKEDW